MGSKMSNMLKRAVQEYTDEIAKKEDKNIQIALDRTMEYAAKKIDTYLEWMQRVYYDGYEPVSYIRSYQLRNKSTRPVNPYAEINTVGTTANLNFGVVFNAKSMNHGSYTIKARWYDKKNKQWKDVKKNKTYTITPGKKGGSKPNEETILSFYQNGIHPNASLEGIMNMAGAPTPTPLFTTEGTGDVYNLIDQWVQSRELQDVFNNELKKLSK